MTAPNFRQSTDLGNFTFAGGIKVPPFSFDGSLDWGLNPVNLSELELITTLFYRTYFSVEFHNMSTLIKVNLR